jgi:pimeloyl-ACP methyl ester carboxylesterase
VGNKDLPERIEQAQWLVSQIPQAQLATLPGVAHMLNMETPQVFTQHVLDFLADVIEQA